MNSTSGGAAFSSSRLAGNSATIHSRRMDIGVTRRATRRIQAPPTRQCAGNSRSHSSWSLQGISSRKTIPPRTSEQTTRTVNRSRQASRVMFTGPRLVSTWNSSADEGFKTSRRTRPAACVGTAPAAPGRDTPSQMNRPASSGAAAAEATPPAPSSVTQPRSQGPEAAGSRVSRNARNPRTASGRVVAVAFSATVVQTWLYRSQADPCPPPRSSRHRSVSSARGFRISSPFSR